MSANPVSSSYGTNSINLFTLRRDLALENKIPKLEAPQVQELLMTDPLPPSGTGVLWRVKDPSEQDPKYTLAFSSIYYSRESPLPNIYNQEITFCPSEGIYKRTSCVALDILVPEGILWSSLDALISSCHQHLIPFDTVNRIMNRYQEIKDPRWFYPFGASIECLRSAPKKTFLLAPFDSLNTYSLSFSNSLSFSKGSNRPPSFIFFRVTDQGRLALKNPGMEREFHTLADLLQYFELAYPMCQWEEHLRRQSETNLQWAGYIANLPPEDRAIYLSSLSSSQDALAGSLADQVRPSQIVRVSSSAYQKFLG